MAKECAVENKNISFQLCIMWLEKQLWLENYTMMINNKFKHTCTAGINKVKESCDE